MRAVPLSFLFLAGAFAQAIQAILVREMLFVFYGNELGLGIFFASWLFWVGVGAWACGAARPREWPALPALLGLFPIAAVAGILVFRLCRGWMGLWPGQFIPLQGLVFWSSLALLPTGLLVGAVIPAACRSVDAPAAYAWDALGGLLGGVLFTALVGATVATSSLLCILTSALGIAVLAVPGRWRAGGALWLALGLAGMLTPLGETWSTGLDRLRWRALQPDMALLASFDTPYQNITVARAPGVTGIFADGKIAAGYPSRETSELEAALFFTQNPGIRRILLVEGAAGGLLPEFLRYPVARIDCVEPDERAFLRLRDAMPREWGEPFRDGRVRLHFSDPRSFVRRADAGSYDLIAALGPDPATARANRLFTKEFYGDAGRALAPDGTYVAKMSSAENYAGAASSVYGASVHATLSSVFKRVLATPGDVSYLIAGDSPGLSLDPKVLAKRSAGLGIAGGSLPPGAFQSLLPKNRVAEVNRSLKEGQGELNTDPRPVAYYLSTLLWARLSGSEWVGALEKVRAAGLWFLGLPLAVFILMRLLYCAQSPAHPEQSRSSASLAMAGLGLWAMAAELILLFAFQNAFGSVYQKLGLLNGLCMAGLAVGSLLAGRASGLRGREGLGMLGVAGAAALLVSALPSLFAGGYFRGHEWTFYLSALSIGALAGAGFPLAARLRRLGGSEGAAAGSVLGAEQLGGVAGALVTGGLLVPLFGIEGAGRAAGAALAVLCLPLLQVEARRLDRLRAWSDLLGTRLSPAGPYPGATWALVGLLLAAGAMHRLVSRGEGKIFAAPAYSETLLASVGGPGRYEFLEKPFPHYVRTTDAGKPGGAAFGSMPLTGDIEGYGGPLHLLMAVSEAGRILGLRLMESRETPAYIEGIEGWLGRFRGLDGTRPIRIGREIDALTGATVTSEAAARIVDRSAKAAADGVLGLKSERTPPGGAVRRAGSPRFWALALFLAAFFPVFLRGGRRARLAYLAGAAAIPGFYANTLFTLVDIHNLSEGHLPGLENPGWLLVAAFIAVTSLLWGAVFCGSVCPFGALQELLWEAGRSLGLRSEPSPGLAGRAGILRLLLLAAALGLAWATGRRGWISFEPMQHIFLLKTGTLTGILIAAVLAGSAAYFRFWCRFLCPTGAVLALANKLALARGAARRRDLSRCAYGVRSEFDATCIQCQHCIQRAPPGASGT